MTNEQLFNRVVGHLAKQGRPAYNRNTDSCHYRMPGWQAGEPVVACGIGGLIPDDQYDPRMEGKRVDLDLGVMAAVGIDKDNEDQKRLARALQAAHDRSAQLGLNPANALLTVADLFGIYVSDNRAVGRMFENWQTK